MTQTAAAATERAPHFVQTTGRPIFTGQGTGALNCRCGQSELVRGYDPRNFLAVDFQCASCGAVTTTPGLSALNSPPVAVVLLERAAAATIEGATLLPGQVLAGREELDRIMQLYQPAGQASDFVPVTAEWLDSVCADYDRLSGRLLATHLDAVAAAEAAKPLSGLTMHPLAWALDTLRTAARDPDWDCSATNEASAATAMAGAFRHFTDCWSHHPLFPEMVTTAAATGFSLHGLALFGAAKLLSDSGNRVAFTPPPDGSGRFRDFALALGPFGGAADRLSCVIDIFDTYAWPAGRKTWEFLELRAAILERLLMSKSRLSARHPGMLILSPGTTASAIEQPLVDAIHTAFHSHGRRYRHLLAISVVLPRIVPTAERNTARFAYTFLPIANPRHTATTVQVGARAGVTG